MTSFSRLETLAPDLVEKLRSLPEDRQRWIGRESARLAAQSAGVSLPGSAGAEPSNATTDENEILARLVERLDDEYGRLSEEGDPSAIMVFRQARAVEAALRACELDPDAPLDAIYEAFHAVEDGGELLRAVDRALDALP